MAIRAINLTAIKHVSHPDDKDEPTIFNIGALDSRISGMLADDSLVVGVNQNGEDEDADVKMARNQLAFKTVQFGLRDFTGFIDDDGEVTYATEKKSVGGKAYDVAKQDIVARIPSDVLTWLSDEISQLNNLGEQEGN